jgi:hypothetical protein
MLERIHKLKVRGIDTFAKSRVPKEIMFAEFEEYRPYSDPAEHQLVTKEYTNFLRRCPELRELTLQFSCLESLLIYLLQDPRPRPVYSYNFLYSIDEEF